MQAKRQKKRYSQSAKGKVANKKYEKKYKTSEKGRATHNKYKKERRKSDPKIKLVITFRNCLNQFLKNSNIKKINKTLKMAGFTQEFLKEYLEKKFKTGMTWQNHSNNGRFINERRSFIAARFLVHAWKVCVPSQVPWVRIPLSPPYQL